MHDSLANPVELPETGASSPHQLAFDWTTKAASSVVENAPPSKSVPPPPPKTVRRLVRALGTATSPTLPKVRRSLAEVVERYLREKGVPYIAVDEAKKALFAGAKLRSFHFVIYRPSGKNWLLWAAKYMNPEIRQDLKQWQEIFGDGFITAVAKQAKDGTLTFKTMEGESLDITPP